VTYKRKKLEDRITDALKSCASSLTPSGGGRWDLLLVNGKELPVTAHVSNEWLLFDAPVSDRVAREDLWRLLCLNATLSGFSKFVVTRHHSVHLRADMPLSKGDTMNSNDALDADAAASLSETCSSLKEAYGAFRAEPQPVHLSSLPDSDNRIEHRAEELRRICVEIGWPFVERAAGRMMVELEVRDSFHQALVEQRSAGTYLSVEISRFDDLKPISRQALSALLLTTGAQVRLARPSVIGKTSGGFEVMFATSPTEGEFMHALSALSIACAACGKEALALRDETIARQYLAYTGFAESPANFSLSVSY